MKPFFISAMRKSPEPKVPECEGDTCKIII
jgi:hypothetical protein